MSSKSRDERHIEKWMFKDPETFVERQAAVRAYKQMLCALCRANWEATGVMPLFAEDALGLGAYCEHYQRSRSAWDLPWQERAEINAMYAEMATEMERENMTKLEMVQEFHRKHNIRLDPQMDNAQIADLRFVLIDEELDELGDALDANDRVGVADALGDLLYVVYGAADVYGIDIDRVFAEIHRSNMTKVSTPEASTKIHKIQKGPDYSPPDLSFVLEHR